MTRARVGNRYDGALELISRQGCPCRDTSALTDRQRRPRYILVYSSRMTTVYQLPLSRFELARSILGRPPADFAYIDAGLIGMSPARIFVDDPEQPATALMTRTYEYFVGGAQGTPLADFIRDAPVESGVWADFYGFVAVDPTWNDRLRELHPDLETIGRRSFRFDPANIDRVRGWRERVPLGLRIVPLTVDLAEKADQEMPGDR